MRQTEDPGPPPSRPDQRWESMGLTVLLIAVCSWPYVQRAFDPSLFDDDLIRVGGLRRFGFGESLLRPFNEHLAPLFECVSWLAWWGVGRRVDRIAVGFEVAAYCATIATMLALGAWVRLETRSRFAMMIAVAWFSLTTVAVETVLWYSASSFQWAAAACLTACLAASLARRSESSSGRVGWLALSVLASAAGPLFSAIGILAGPLAGLRLLILDDTRRVRRGTVLVPLVGTLVYGVLLLVFRDHGVGVSASVRANFDLLATLGAMIRAPGLVLVPGLLGLESLSGSWADGLAISLTLVLGVGLVIRAGRDRVTRGLIVVGLGFVIGGYGLVYSARAQAGDRWIFAVGRYHLFPELGLIAATVAWLAPWFRTLERTRPRIGPAGLVVVVALALVWQANAIQAARPRFRFPDQDQVVAAALRLEAACWAEQVPLTQAIRIIDPTQPRWFPRPLPFHPLLYLFGAGPSTVRWPDSEARSRVIARLSPSDREAIFGGLDAARYSRPVTDGRPAQSLAAQSVGGAGWLFWHEFPVPADSGAIEAVALSGITPGTKVEIWWSGDDGVWTVDRSVRWITPPEVTALAVERLPHWRARFARRFRVVRRGRPIAATDHPALFLFRPAL